MVRPKILDEQPVSMAEVKEELASIKKKYDELNFRAAKTEEYLAWFVKHDKKQIMELVEKIHKLDIPRLKDEHVLKIADLMPGTIEDLKVILQGYSMTVTNENIKKIVDIVAPFASDK